MGKGFEDSARSIRNLKNAWRQADTQRRAKCVIHFGSLALMAAALIWAFGGAGSLFCGAFFLHQVNKQEPG